MSTPDPTLTLNTSSTHPPGPDRFTSGLLVRLTPQLHELIHQGAEVEGQGLAEFMRDAAIYRLGTLGLVPVVGDEEAEAA